MGRKEKLNTKFLDDALKGQIYDENNVKPLLSELGYQTASEADEAYRQTFGDDEVVEWKLKILDNDSPRYLFIRTKNNKVMNTAIIKKNRDSYLTHVSKYSCLIVVVVVGLILAVSLFLGYKFISFVVTGIGDFFESDNQYEYLDPDDYDKDGDVDLDDGTKYLEDSLKEDANDNDDW